jgi:hypothetical protein
LPATTPRNFGVDEGVRRSRDIQYHELLDEVNCVGRS